MRYLFGLLLLVCQMAQAQPDPFPQVAASYLVQLNGSLLWEKESNRRLPPASLTKLMAALLVLEDYKPRAVVLVGKKAAQESGARIGLRGGERFHAEDLLAAMLIGSANDACHALADHVAGSHESFVRRMNHRAQQLGLRDTHFGNACGHDAGNHFSTARDLAVLANELLKSKAVMELAAKSEARIATTDGARHYLLANKNALIGRYPGAVGLKSGYTPNAGKCLVAYAERTGARVLLVMLNAPDRWWDAADILDLAFAQVRRDS
ncbi:MAG: D-alanyl-D-alanine carboxypeptidase (penicillin-binding protein 5/6) [Gallionellaceae bacterium]|nr:MAG: D-alanyl-D-alanine carboxypeptidase (penicillin-binding protein 5/6) [Gallionellaceae bacterium]